MLPLQPPPPLNTTELMGRAENLMGQTFAELAESAGVALPNDLRRNKGWVGQLLEWHLGATAGSKPEQDFVELGIELKTIPVDKQGKPLESTFICVAPLLGIAGERWENSSVKNKLSKVLWIPIEGERSIPLGERRVGAPLLWTPTLDEESQLRQDWEELMEMIALGQVHQISAHHGEVLQLRPKAANGSVLTSAIGCNGEYIQTRPRGFYLKTKFTNCLLARHFI